MGTSSPNRVQVGFGYAAELPTMDFETYSEAGYILDYETGKVKGVSKNKAGIAAVGTPAYAEHPSTRIICMYYDLLDGKGRRGWIPGTPNPSDLLNHIEQGGLIEAHGLSFEFWIWNMVGVRRHGWPPLKLEQCYCSMAKARRYNLPGALGAIPQVLGTVQKDKRGKQLIQLLSRPNSQTKNRQYFQRTPLTDWPLFLEMYEYCDGDVLSEQGISLRIPDLTDYERQTWLIDQTINLRGVQLDMEALDASLEIMRQAEQRYTQELKDITDYKVGSVSEVKKMGEWLASQGLILPNLTADTVQETLERDDIPPRCRRVLEIRDILGGANVKKLHTLKRSVNSDGRLRNQYVYCGADRTGRWSSGGAQLQNITSKGPKSLTCNSCGHISGSEGALTPCPSCKGMESSLNKDWTIEGVEQALEDIKTRNLDLVVNRWGDPATTVTGCLRGLFVAKPGHDFVCCDFSAIEAVVAACLSRCQWRIDVFSTHAKIYEASAAKATGISFEEILEYKRVNGQHHPARKTIGKVRELAGGYGGWVNAWKNFGADAFMTDDEIKNDVLKWREESPEIVEMWGGQFKNRGPGRWDFAPELFGLEGAVINAILNPGEWFGHIDIGYIVHEDILFCRLPSGRFLHYWRPRLVPTTHRLTREPAYKITYEGYNTNPKKGKIGWIRMETYGGQLFENVDQAASADIQAEALVRLEHSGYPIVMHTHDEATAEVVLGQGSIEEMVSIMETRPSWASWWPIRADGWRHHRFQK